ncbi:ParB/RepB/Spo0J family partition protein [Effusibacillus lacus]|uniref:Chromosome partitioning protein ParB n=1 Tax=Effusibacillus lacus TaxID=1348429 RepID=A0A292YQ81_9BACL|nr:ParB/RepB/Spo0J family partition protein [Effusibacillus lacus]TCS75744.1 ParB family chromosome partitioning protein [Effusibacillus lacus]GAX91061.1 chromosome partitioning protein ParB [Effusibacillus lacus]
MKVLNVALDLIDEDLQQPRYNFDESSLKELAESIKELGLLNPIKVRPIENGRYKIVFGNRRYKACRLLGLKEIPCILAENASDLDIYLEQLTENIQRESFTPIEEAKAFEKLMSDPSFKVSKKYLASRLGKSLNYISQKLDLLNFGKEIQQKIHGGSEIIKGRLTEEQVLPLKNVAIEYRDALAKKVAEEEVSSQDVKLIAKLFSASDISDDSKEYLLQKPSHQLINDWFEYEQEKKRIKEKPEIKLVDDNTLPEIDIEGNFNYFQIEVVKKLHQLLSGLPSRCELSEEVLSSIKKVRIEHKEEFLQTVDSLLSLLEGHTEQWKQIRKLASEIKIKLVK